MDETLLQLLACPQDKGPLYYVADRNVMFNPRLGRTYPIVDGITVMLVDEATTLDAAAAAELLARCEAEGLPQTMQVAGTG